MESPLIIKSIKEMNEQCNFVQSTIKKLREKNSLQFDLNETLIHSEIEKTSLTDEQIFVKIGREQKSISSKCHMLGIFQRIFLIFLIYIFTAVLKEYVDKCCTEKDENYYKVLSKVNQHIEKTVIIYNSLSGMQLNLYKNNVLFQSKQYAYKLMLQQVYCKIFYMMI
ncbi:unnamed protein product [Paramecium sonneborni]|uniref:FCP1 homology domain-containing protein n=1 Tax=Paramecium sonneborni TaxID=65129 RepID=A0A8S1KP63_9CILI|nr:unnamed protein product [Paramecium sonneborni]